MSQESEANTDVEHHTAKKNEACETYKGSFKNYVDKMRWVGLQKNANFGPRLG